MRRGTILLLGTLVAAGVIIAGALDYNAIKTTDCYTAGQPTWGVRVGTPTCGSVNARASAHAWGWAGGVFAVLLVTGGLIAAVRPGDRRRAESAPIQPFSSEGWKRSDASTDSN